MSELSLTSDQQISETSASVMTTNPVSDAIGNDWQGMWKSFLRSIPFDRLVPAIGIISILGIAAFAWLILKEPPQRDLFRGLPENDKLLWGNQKFFIRWMKQPVL